MIQLQEAQAELQTSLLVTKSNLTLALSNTEMLEEALQRVDSMKGKDLGWRRWSDREGLLKRSQTVAGSSLSNEPTTPGIVSDDGSESAKRHTHHGATGDGRSSSEIDRRPPYRSHSDMPSPHPQYPAATTPNASSATAPPSRAATPTPPPAASEGGFFSKFRFGKVNASSSHLPDSTGRSAPLANASLPALALSLEEAVASSPIVEYQRDVLLSAEKKRTEELKKQLEDERKAKAEALAEKESMEVELEGLSAALFEEVCLPFILPFSIVRRLSLPVACLGKQNGESRAD